MKHPVPLPDASVERLRDFLNPQVRPLSVVLTEAMDRLRAEVTASGGARVSLGQLVDQLSARGLAPLILLLALLNLVMIIPGSAIVFAVPVVFLGLGLTLGARQVWLPARVRGWGFDLTGLEKTVRRAVPWLARVERLARPRFWFWPGLEPVADRLYGAFVVVFALLIALPIPFGNTMPALTIILISLGVTTRDGIWVLAGLITGLIAIGVVLGFAGAATFLGMHVLGG